MSPIRFQEYDIVGTRDSERLQWMNTSWEKLRDWLTHNFQIRAERNTQSSPSCCVCEHQTMGFTHPRSEVSTVLSRKLAEMVTTKSERLLPRCQSRGLKSVNWWGSGKEQVSQTKLSFWESDFSEIDRDPHTWVEYGIPRHQSISNSCRICLTWAGYLRRLTWLTLGTSIHAPMSVTSWEDRRWVNKIIEHTWIQKSCSLDFPNNWGRMLWALDVSRNNRDALDTP
jgi:hypothetical protein